MERPSLPLLPVMPRSPDTHLPKNLPLSDCDSIIHTVTEVTLGGAGGHGRLWAKLEFTDARCISHV